MTKEVKILNSDAPNWNDVAIWVWGLAIALGGAVLWLLRVIFSMIKDDYEEERKDILRRITAVETTQAEHKKILDKISSKLEKIHQNINIQNNSFRTVPDHIFGIIESQNKEIIQSNKDLKNILNEEIALIKQAIK